MWGEGRVVLSEKQEKPPRGFTAEVNGRPRIQFVKAKVGEENKKETQMFVGYSRLLGEYGR